MNSFIDHNLNTVLALAIRFTAHYIASIPVLSEESCAVPISSWRNARVETPKM